LGKETATNSLKGRLFEYKPNRGTAKDTKQKKVMEKIVIDLITSKGGVIEKDQPKFIQFKLGTNVVTYSKMDESIELNGEDVALKTIENL
jgi:hypothetical protein